MATPVRAQFLRSLFLRSLAYGEQRPIDCSSPKLHVRTSNSCCWILNPKIHFRPFQAYLLVIVCPVQVLRLFLPTTVIRQKENTMTQATLNERDLDAMINLRKAVDDLADQIKDLNQKLPKSYVIEDLIKSLHKLSQAT
jgi:hypothetical protein